MARTKIDFRPLNKVVNQFTKPLGVRACVDTHFCALSEKKKITFAIFENIDTAVLFNTNMATHFPQVLDFGLSSFTMSLLHEMGHCLDPYDEPAEESDIRSECDEIAQAGEVERSNEIYFTLPSERKATEWAVIFAEYHLQECRDFERKFFTALEKFLKKYDYEG